MIVWRRKGADSGLSHDSSRVAPLLEPFTADSYESMVLSVCREEEQYRLIGVAGRQLASAGVEVGGMVKARFDAHGYVGDAS